MKDYTERLDKQFWIWNKRQQWITEAYTYNLIRGNFVLSKDTPYSAATSWGFRLEK